MEKLSWLEIFISIIGQFTPVWIAMAIIFALSIIYKRRLGLYGRLFDSPVGMIGFGIVLFWVLAALLADVIVTHDPPRTSLWHEKQGSRNARARC